jgi:dihydropteroate synthase
MGIVNATPDYFYAGSRVPARDAALERAMRHLSEGADIIDVGGESTRPGSAAVAEEEELQRVIPVIESIRSRSDVTLSVDTWKPRVAREALKRGVEIVNDISGLRRKNWRDLAGEIADAGAWIVLMHMRGTPESMQRHAHYRDVVDDVSRELDESLQRAFEAGVSPGRIIIDPGIGFAKRAAHNLALIAGIPVLRRKGYPLLIGLSRKSFLAQFSGPDPEDRLYPTIAANALAVYLGADVVRVHDVRAAVETARLVDRVKIADPTDR